MRIFFLLFSTILCLSGLQAQQNRLQQQIRQLIESKKAQVGVAVITNGQDTLTVNNDVQYPMMSVFKLHQALAVINYIEKQGLSLDTPVYIRKEQLHPNTYSPLRDKYPQGNISLPIRELLTYTLQLSDNNACDILFEYTGGTEATDRYIRSLGINDFRICATEEDMHRDLNLCYQNWTSPLAAACLANKLIECQLFTLTNQDFIKETMLTCETGKDRIPKPFSGTSIRTGHKTGTGDRNEKGEMIGCNDVGFILLPDGTYYTLAVFVCNSSETDQTNAQIIADISETVFRFIQP